MKRFYGAILVLYATNVIASFHDVMAKTCSKYFFFHSRFCIALLHWCIQYRLPVAHRSPSMLHSQHDSYSVLMSKLLLTSVRRGRWRPVTQSSTSSKIYDNRAINLNTVIEKFSNSFPRFESQGTASPSLEYNPHLLHYISTRLRCSQWICSSGKFLLAGRIGKNNMSLEGECCWGKRQVWVSEGILCLE